MQIHNDKDMLNLDSLYLGREKSIDSGKRAVRATRQSRSFQPYLLRADERAQLDCRQTDSRPKACLFLHVTVKTCPIIAGWKWCMGTASVGRQTKGISIRGETCIL